MTDSTAKEEGIEKSAAIQHAIWSHWMKYLFSPICGWRTKYGYHIGEDQVKKWIKQMNTKYDDLNEKEKESYRQIVRDFLV